MKGGAGGTVGEFITSSIRKEFLQIWLQEEPSSFDAEVLGAVTDASGQRIAEDLVRLAKIWLPGLQLEVSSPLVNFMVKEPDVSAAARPDAGEPARLTVSESLQSFFESVDCFEQAPAGTRLAELKSRLPQWFNNADFRLPPQAIFSLSAGIGAVLLRAPRLSIQEDFLPPGAVPEDALGGSQDPEVIVKQLLQCRRRIFSLERELLVRSRAEKEKVSYEKAERAKAEARLMEINSQLEERLKARTEELRKAGQKLIEAQRGMDHAKFLLEDKNKQIAKFEYKEQNHNKLQDEHKEKEKDYHKRMMRLGIQEDLMKQREEYRLDKLQKYLKGEEQTENLSEAEANINQRQALDRLEDEFEHSFKQRQNKFEVSLRDFDRKLEEKRNQYEVLNKDLLRAGVAQTHKKAVYAEAGVQASMAPDRDERLVEAGADGLLLQEGEDGLVAAAAPGEGGGAEDHAGGAATNEERTPGEVQDPMVMAEEDLPPLGRRASGISEEVEQEAVAAFNLGMMNARDAL